MPDDIKSFIKKKSTKRDFYISSKIDENYIEPIIKSWKEYGIKKREVILLGMVIGYKLEQSGKIKYITDYADIEKKKGKPKDMGQLSDFSEKELSLMVSICINKYGVEDTINRFDEIFDEIRELSEKGIAFLYHNLFKKFEIKGKQLEHINDIDKWISSY